MAKVAYSKLNCKVNNDVKEVKFNDQIIEVKQYIPIEEKLNIIANVLNNSVDDTGYYNIVKVNTFTVLELIYNYTNISFTDKQKENPHKLYDAIVSSELNNVIFNEIPKLEIDYLYECIRDQIQAVYQYRNSVVGILDHVSNDYDNLNTGITTLQEKLSNGENIEFLKEVMAKLG